jgi:hypothetical protein
MPRPTLEQINLEWLKSATLDDLKSVMRQAQAKDDPILIAVNALLRTEEGAAIANEMMNDPDYVPVSKRQPTPEEAAQIAADQALAEQQATEAEQARVAQEAAAQQIVADQAAQDAANFAADAALAAKFGGTIIRDVNGQIEKIVVDYQVRNDEGHPVGRPTHFEGRTWIDIASKLVAAHSNAVTYSERIKANRHKSMNSSIEANSRSERVDALRAESERLAAEAVNEKDPTKMQDAIKKSAAAEREAQTAVTAQEEHNRVVAEAWFGDHMNDFLVCQASISLIGGYLKANSLPVSYTNLEKAFQAVKHQLPPVPTDEQQVVSTAVPVSAAVSTNSAPAAAAASAAPAAPIAQPAAVASVPETPTPTAATPPAAATAQTPTPVAANQPTATRKPGVNGGLQPGSLSAARPSASETTQQAPEETRAALLREIGKMEPAIYRRRLTTDKSFRSKLEAAGIIDKALRP